MENVNFRAIQSDTGTHRSQAQNGRRVCEKGIMRKKNEKEREKKEKNRWKKGPRLHVRGLHQIKKSAGIFPIERSIGFQF